MYQDLSNILLDFLFLKKSFLEEEQSNSELRATKEILQKQLKEVNDLIKLEGRKLYNDQEVAMREQKSNALLLQVKGENLRLSKQVKDFEGIISDLKMEKNKLEKHYNDLKLSHTKQLEDLKVSCENKILETKQELNSKVMELAKKLEESTCEKSIEIDMLILDYEEKLQNLENRLMSKENEITDIQKKATADIAIYQKKMLALEHLYNELQAQRQEAMLPPPGPTIRCKQLSPKVATTKSSLNSQISSTDGAFHYKSSPKFHPNSSSHSSTAFLCSPTDFQPDTTSTIPMQHKPSKGRSKPQVLKRKNSEVHSTKTFTDVQNTVALMQRGLTTKNSRFSMAKKRKLFSANQNTI